MSAPKAVTKRRRLLLDALHTFESAARNSSFAGAAAEMSVTSSAISHQIRRLEKHLDVDLFDRSGKYPVLTKEGERLASSLEPLFGQMHSAIDELKTSSQTVLTVSVMGAFGATWLARGAMQFANAHPELHLRVLTSDDLVDLYAENVDLGIRFGAGAYPGLVVELLSAVDMVPVCSPEFLAHHRDALRDPGDLQHTVLIRDESASRDPRLPTWTDWLEQVGVAAPQVRCALTFQDPSFAQQAALAGQGVALGMSCLVDADIAAGRLVTPFAHRIRSPFSFWLVCSEARAATRKVASFKAWLHALMRTPDGA
ncbi:transcriptional regulator [Xenophilus aerolatus]|nr:transcriptional regulator [Xenophilus aerolatus]